MQICSIDWKKHRETVYNRIFQIKKGKGNLVLNFLVCGSCEDIKVSYKMIYSCNYKVSDKVDETINIFLLTGNEFMTHRHLRRPELAYSICGTFIKNDGRVKELQMYLTNDVS